MANPITPKSTAAGAYQITIETYNDCIAYDYFSGKEFDPASQEQMAIRLLEFQGKKDISALCLIRKGEIESAINATHLYKRWSCLPGGVEPQIKNMAEFIEKWRSLLQ